MAVEQKYAADVEAILSHIHDNGGELWATPDKRLIKGQPFHTLASALFLVELGVEPDEPILKEAADLIFSTWKEDGRFKLYPKGSVLPCHTALAANTLCHLGYAADGRIQITFQHLLENTYHDGGWRCNKFYFGRGPETEYSNPYPTLLALNAFRFSDYLNKEPLLDQAVEFLLSHWDIKTPIGPCHYGIGSRFMQVEYPMRDYNLFQYVYVLSFYDRAKHDRRFQEALAALQSKLVDGQIVVERVHKKMEDFLFCAKNAPSELGTKRYMEILRNIS